MRDAGKVWLSQNAEFAELGQPDVPVQPIYMVTYQCPLFTASEPPIPATGKASTATTVCAAPRMRMVARGDRIAHKVDLALMPLVSATYVRHFADAGRHSLHYRLAVGRLSASDCVY